ncbi:MAG: hypothetical protein P4L71_00455 [Acetobacteraceae bacterium]|nr:hypothetical protein [Acetobacteraceae bacterium]
MTYLLDVNVLIALIDPAHVSHDQAHHWFAQEGSRSWASCPLTENGVIRVVSHPKYPNTPGSPAVVAAVVARLRQLPNHMFWPDDISLLDEQRIDRGKLLSASQLTDSYLLALAVAHDGRLASLDRRLTVGAVHGGQAALCLI